MRYLNRTCRRKFLQSIPVVSVVSLAGCTSKGEDSGSTQQSTETRDDDDSTPPPTEEQEESLNEEDNANVFALMIGVNESFATDDHYVSFTTSWRSVPDNSRKFKAELEYPSGKVITKSKETSEVHFDITFTGVWPESFTKQEAYDAFSQSTYRFYIDYVMVVENSCSDPEPGIFGEVTGCDHTYTTK